MEQVVAAGAAGDDVDGREDALVGEGAVELQLHVAGALELLEDDFVHLAASVDECRGDDGERAAAFDVTGCAEEALGLLQGVGIHTAGEDLTAGRGCGVVGTCQTCDAVEEDDHVVAALYHALGFLEHDTGNLHVALGGLVEGGGDDLCVDGACHVGDLLGALVDEEHHEVYLGVVGGDGVGYLLHEDGLTCLGLCHDECALSLADGGEEIDDAHAGRVVIATAELELLIGEQGR